MPPPSDEVSDEDSTGDAIPFKNANNTAGESGDEDQDSDGGDDVYVVESVVGHEFLKNGKLMLNVKWKGYDDPADQTLEPEEGLMEGAEEAVQEYYLKIGGRPEPPPKQTKGKRKSIAASVKSTPDRPVSKRQKLSSREETNGTDVSGLDIQKGIPDWVKDKDHWEHDVVKVQTIERDGIHGLIAYLNWTNGKTTKVSVDLCYDRIPKMMLKFYEAHLVFRDTSAPDE